MLVFFCLYYTETSSIMVKQHHLQALMSCKTKTQGLHLMLQLLKAF